MPVGRITFNLRTEQNEFNAALHGMEWASAMWDLDQHLRDRIKYNDGLSRETSDAYKHIRDKIIELLDNYSLTFDILM